MSNGLNVRFPSGSVGAGAPPKPLPATFLVAGTVKSKVTVNGNSTAVRGVVGSLQNAAGGADIPQGQYTSTLVSFQRDRDNPKK